MNAPCSCSHQYIITFKLYPKGRVFRQRIAHERPQNYLAICVSILFFNTLLLTLPSAPGPKQRIRGCLDGIDGLDVDISSDLAADHIVMYRRKHLKHRSECCPFMLWVRSINNNYQRKKLTYPCQYFPHSNQFLFGKTMLIEDVKITQQFIFALQEASLDADNDLQDPIREPFNLNADPWNFF